MSSSNTAITASYAPQAGSFAVVPSSNRNVVNSSSSGLVSSTVVQQTGSQPIPVRFNPQLIVDGNKESTSYDGLLQKQLGGHQQVHKHNTFNQIEFISVENEITKHLIYYFRYHTFQCHRINR